MPHIDPPSPEVIDQIRSTPMPDGPADDKGMSYSAIRALLATPRYKLADLLAFDRTPENSDRIENWIRRGWLDLTFQPVLNAAGGWLRAEPAKGHRRYTIGDALQCSTLQAASDNGIPIGEVRPLVIIVFRRAIEMLRGMGPPGPIFVCVTIDAAGGRRIAETNDILMTMRMQGVLGCVVIDVDEIVGTFLNALLITDSLIMHQNSD